MIFCSIFGDRMANLGLIDFKIGFYIKVNVTAGQNKFEVHIYQFVQMPLWRMEIEWPGHFSSNFDVLFCKFSFFKDKSNDHNN